MEPVQIATALDGLIGLGVIVVVVYWPWQRLCIDHARDIIFERRDAVFDLAARSRLGFGSEPYEQVRSSMNAMIRLAHCVTFPRLAVVIAYSNIRNDRMQSGGICSAIAQIPDVATRDEVTRLVKSAESEMVRLMIWRSPLLMSIVLILSAVRLLTRIRPKIEPILLRTIELAVRNEARQAG